MAYKTVICLPRSEGGITLPDLRAKLLALVEGTVTKWGATPAGYKQLLGAYRITGDTASGEKLAWVTLRNTGRQHAELRQGKNLWNAENQIMGAHGVTNSDPLLTAGIL